MPEADESDGPRDDEAPARRGDESAGRPREKPPRRAGAKAPERRGVKASPRGGAQARRVTVVLDAEAYRRLTVHKLMTGETLSEAVARLVLQHLPRYRIQTLGAEVPQDESRDRRDDESRDRRDDDGP